MRAKKAIQTRLAAEDPVEMTAAMRQAANHTRFYEQTDPSLPPEERHRQADALRRAHMAELTLRSIAARRAKAAGRGQ